LIENRSGQIESRTSGQSIKCIQISGKFPNRLFGIDLRTKVGGGGGGHKLQSTHIKIENRCENFRSSDIRGLWPGQPLQGARRGATGGWSGVATGYLYLYG